MTRHSPGPGGSRVRHRRTCHGSHTRHRAPGRRLDVADARAAAAAFVDWTEVASAADLDVARDGRDTNLFGVWRMVQALLPMLRESPHPRVVNGDEIGLLAPHRAHERSFGGIEFAPADARRLILVADETAVPALASIAEALSTDADDVWETAMYSSSGGDAAGALDEAAHLGPDDTYAWVAGDSDTVKACRRLLVGEGGMPRHQVAFMGYWKQGRAS